MEKVILVVVDFKHKDEWSAHDVAEECKELIAACQGEVVQTVFCVIRDPSPKFLIGEGKVDEIAQLSLAEDCDSVVFSHDLKGSQQRNLEEVLKIKTIDRTQLILDIFARRATSQEGKMQVELAQLEYLLPRLTGRGVEMSRLGGGIGTLGPGETKLEVDKRKINQRIDHLKKQLKDVSAARKLTRKRRKEQHVPMISLVGYTNAGKSTLLNTLTSAGRQVKDGLFTTLDPLSRHYVLPNHQRVIFSDTVGFLHALPHGLVEAFHATLEEVLESDLLVLVLDISNPKFFDFYQSVMSVLKDIGAEEKKIVVALNKIDQIDSQSDLEKLSRSFNDPVLISAKNVFNIDLLVEKISDVLGESLSEIEAHIPLSRMDIVNLIHEQGQVHAVDYGPEEVKIWATVPHYLASRISIFLK